MSPERRAQIIREAMLNLHRFQLESGDGASSLDTTARPVASLSGTGRASSPPEDDCARWKREAEEFARQRELGRAETCAEEARHIKGQQEASDLFWQSVDERIAKALSAERAFLTNLLGDALAAVSEIADATTENFDQLDVKLNSLAQLLQQLREGNEAALQRARDKAESLDLPNPLPRREVVN